VPDMQIESTPPVNPQAVPVAGIISRASGPLFLLDPEQLISKINAKVAA
jgi:chemotaxis signal transduction protein